MNYIISIEGQSIPMPEEIASDDQKIKDALAPYFPGAANSKIMRSDPANETVTVTVIKQAGTKGSSSILEKLISAPESLNPAVQMYRELGDVDGKMVGMSTEELLQLDEKISTAQDEGTQQGERMDRTLALLIDAEPTPSLQLVEGF